MPPTAKPKRSAQRATPPDDGLTPEARAERDAARYEALAREHGVDLSEAGFNEALKKIGRRATRSSE